MLPLDPAVAARLTAAVPQRRPGVPLSARETDILRLVAQGMTNREIGRRLHLSEGTVKNHLSRLLERLGLRDRTQAAVYARDHGLTS
ncbi:response regulator transcription factor [Catellatospora bangladeshensis]|uniref:response regulator transcription factor n=1 Tax=Catellatospora bangladeshensis TaxID=310355 RepID=UPI0036122B36